MKTWMKTVGVTAVVVLLAGLSITAVAFAQTPAPPPGVGDGPVRGDASGFDRGPRPGARGEYGALVPALLESLRQATDATMAEILGMTVDELEAARESGQRIPDLMEEKGIDMADIQSAMDAARDTVLDQAVAEGTITQEQADVMKNHPGPGFDRGGRPGQRGEYGALAPALMESLRQATNAAMAEILGMTVDELAAARESGQRIPELMEDKGIAMADIQSAMDAARDTVLDQAVAEGTITQEQADALNQPPMRGFGHGPGPRNGGQQAAE